MGPYGHTVLSEPVRLGVAERMDGDPPPRLQGPWPPVTRGDYRSGRIAPQEPAPPRCLRGSVALGRRRVGGGEVFTRGIASGCEAWCIRMHAQAFLGKRE